MINIENDDSYKSTPKEKKNIFDTVISVITGSIAPAIPLLAGAGMGKVLLLILTISGLLSDKSQTYQILNLILIPAISLCQRLLDFQPLRFLILINI